MVQFVLFGNLSREGEIADDELLADVITGLPIRGMQYEIQAPGYETNALRCYRDVM